MTNLIEQMMKTAGVEKQEIIGCCTTQEYFECQDKHNCANCDKCRDIEYPHFTPAKQLELIKLINKKHRNIRLCCSQSDGTYGVQVNPVVRAFGMYYESESFEDLIAIVTFELLKANELDKAEVKRILEDE